MVVRQEGLQRGLILMIPLPETLANPSNLFLSLQNVSFSFFHCHFPLDGNSAAQCTLGPNKVVLPFERRKQISGAPSEEKWVTYPWTELFLLWCATSGPHKQHQVLAPQDALEVWLSQSVMFSWLYWWNSDSHSLRNNYGNWMIKSESPLTSPELKSPLSIICTTSFKTLLQAICKKTSKTQIPCGRKFLWNNLINLCHVSVTGEQQCETYWMEQLVLKHTEN